MIADVILGNNVDTPLWIKNLKANHSKYILVIDYEYTGQVKLVEGVLYLSPNEAEDYIKKFDSICFYKSVYIYPGMIELRSMQNKKRGKN